MGNALVWFRNDLRLLDNDALRLACERHKAVKAIVVRTPKQWLEHDWSAIKWDLYERRLCALADDLASLGIELTVLNADDYAQLPEVISQFCHSQKLDRVFWNRDYPLDELNRDAAVDACLRAADIDVVQCDSNLCVAPEQIKNGKGEYYRVFTPFFKAWLKHLVETGVTPPYARDALVKGGKVEHRVSREQPLQDASPVLSSAAWSVSEAEIRQQTQAFVRERVSAYQSDRDRPAIDGTSMRSAYFEIGVISPRVVLHLLQKHSPEFPYGLNQGMHTWLSEIAWREFYQHLMFHEPRLSRGESFVAATDAIKWRNNTREFEAWCEGTTGFPIVDAGMRQLNATGWMHNRVRMIVASFLVKDLHIDWRWGERYFMQRLIDGSFPANNGGWQWSAGTGTDAAPYFRVFNPARQSEKFDPDGEYIRTWIKELEPVPRKYIHEPANYLRATYGDESPYPQPIVDHSERREQFIAMFKAAKG